MTVPTILNDQAFFYDVMPHVIQAVSFNGYTNYGRPTYDQTTLRQYRCYIDRVDTMNWQAAGTNHGMPFQAWVLGVPLNGTVPKEIAETDQVTIIQPTTIQLRRLGNIHKYYDQYGYFHNMVVTFE